MGEIDPKVWDRFDAVFVQDFTGYLHKKQRLDDALRRVGLYDRVVREWNFPNPFNRVFAAQVRLDKSCNNVGTFDCTMGHYRIMKTSVARGFREILVMEDDVRFIKDLDVLYSAVRSIPDDYSVAKFEWFVKRVNPDDIWGRVRKTGSCWARCNDLHGLGCGMYAMSLSGMKWKLKHMDGSADAAFGRVKCRSLSSIDTYEGPPNSGSDVNIYLSVPVLALQSVAYRPMHKRFKGYDSFLYKGTFESYDGYSE